MAGLFITGTNTERGKTFVTATLAAALLERGISPGLMKPVETGSGEPQHTSDICFVEKSSGLSLSDRQRALASPYLYSYPSSPHLAAEIDALPYPSIETIVANYRELDSLSPVVLVEGAGGVLVPLDRLQKVTIADMIEALNIPVLIVSANVLGTINDTLLTIGELKRRNITIAGFLFNHTAEGEGEKRIEEDNISVIETFSDIPFLGEVSFLQAPQREDFARAGREVVDSLIERGFWGNLLL